MKILLVRPGPNFSVADVARGWARGLAEMGADVADFALDYRLNFHASACVKRNGRWVRALDDEDAVRLTVKSLLAAAYEFWPDVILLVSCFYVPNETLDLLRSRGHRVVILHTESPYEDDKQVARAEHADLNLINDPTNVAWFRSVAPTMYAPHAYDPSVHHPRVSQPEHQSDFCFVGTGYDSRVAFFEEVDWTGIDVALAGNWTALDDGSPLRKLVAHDIGQCVDNDEAVKLYASAKASANLYRVESNQPELSAGWAMGPREVELAAMGVPFLRDPRGEGDAVLPMLPTFDGSGDFGDKLRWLLADDDRRQRLGEEARAAVADRTFANHARQLLNLLAP